MIKTYRAVGGTVEPLDIDAATHDEVTEKTGHGVYATFRTYQGDRVFRPGRQFGRMQSSAALLDQPFPLPVAYLRAVSRRALEAASFDDSRLRITSLHESPEVVIISVEPFTPPTEAQRSEGVPVGLVNHARATARAKDSRWVADRVALWEGQGDVYEVMLFDEAGYVLEGLSSNFYALVAGTLHTADEGILAGVARSIVLDVAPDVLPVELTPIPTDALPRLEGAFLTSSSRGIIPIHTIAGQGVPLADAVFTLQRAYDARVESELEPL